jgi:hypothetical protein
MALKLVVTSNMLKIQTQREKGKLEKYYVIDSFVNKVITR